MMLLDMEKMILDAIGEHPKTAPALYLSERFFLHLPKPRWYRFWRKRRLLAWLKLRNIIADQANAGHLFGYRVIKNAYIKGGELLMPKIERP